jgi:acyl dehydratase
MEPCSLTTPNIQPDLQLEFSFSVSAEMMSTFANLSGDHHPVHVDDAYAQSRGFKGRLVYGGLLVAQVSRLVGKELPIEHCFETRLEINFCEPLYVGEVAKFCASVATISDSVGIVLLKFIINSSDNRKIARGKVEVFFGDR